MKARLQRNNRDTSQADLLHFSDHDCRQFCVVPIYIYFGAGEGVSSTGSYVARLASYSLYNHG